jgi:hypothetical protein
LTTIVGLDDEQMRHLEGVAREVPHRMRQDFVEAVFARLREHEVDVITMQQLAAAVAHAIRWIGLRG